MAAHANRLASELEQILRKRLGHRGGALLLDFRNDEPLLMRQPAGACQAPIDSGEALARLHSVLPELWPEFHLTKFLKSDMRAHLAVATGLACEAALILSHQMGATINGQWELLPPQERFIARFAQWSCERGHMQKSIQAFNRHLLLSFSKYMTDQFRGASILQLQQKGRHVLVQAFASNATVVGRESLAECLAQISKPHAETYDRRRDQLKRMEEQHFGDPMRLLAQISPEMAAAVETAWRTKTTVGYQVAQAQVRGMPADVVVYIHATRGPAGEFDPCAAKVAWATVIARRAHEEFVLENSGGNLFYFPPIQLVATLQLSCFPPGLSVGLPTVRMPAGGMPWIHPYTNALGKDPFGTATMLPENLREPMCEPSQKGRRVMKQAGKSPVAESRTGSFCLEGQRAHVAQLEKPVQQAWQAGSEPDFFTLVAGVWDITRLGLTRAHERNQSAPRVEMISSNMYYPISNRSSIARTQLAARIFPYAPGKTESTWHQKVRQRLRGRLPSF